MEELLNKLIKKGWKPFGWDDKLSSLHKEYGVGKWYIRFHNGMDSELFYLRELVSKESGLWQFVCENGMVDKNCNERCNNDISIGVVRKEFWEDKEYQYRIIESALKDEDELEDFLIENIKIS